MLTPFFDRFRHPERAECGDAEATLAALVKPSARTSQSEAFRATTAAAMLREFDRAAAPAKEAPTPLPVEDNTRPPVTVDGVTMVHLEKRDDPQADADAIRAIVARHRAHLGR